MDEEKAKSFLRMIQRSQRGRLKVYLGYCAGVGKTYRMLQEGQALLGEGIDVVAGYIETHGRDETAALLDGLERVPRLVREYRGITVEEMDVDAVLARRPAVALIDELAHTNVPGSRNEKRYGDVQEILAAGIHVITTLNIQHLESLYNTVENLVGVKVRERLPDSLLTEADQIVNIDLSSQDLRKRLEEGRVYARDKIQTALANFFTVANLEKLRELTLRELAAQIDTRRKDPTDEDGGVMPDQVMVCLSSRGPNSEKLLRYASRFAGRLNKNWYALYVQRRHEEPLRIDASTQAVLAETLTLAKQLGAIVFIYKGEDLAETILRFAREYHVGHIIVGTPAPVPFLRRLLGRKPLYERLLHSARSLNLVIVDTTVATEAVPDVPRRAGDEEDGAPRLTRYLGPETIVISREILLKEEVLRALVRLVCREPAEAADVLDRLLDRERESSTFFNQGVAFPHLRLVQGTPTRLALAVVPSGIAGLDTTRPVTLVFLFLTADDQVELQARLLAAASRLAGNSTLVNALLGCTTAAGAFREIERWERMFR